jgi:hypothetical protein
MPSAARAVALEALVPAARVVVRVLVLVLLLLVVVAVARVWF